MRRKKYDMLTGSCAARTVRKSDIVRDQRQIVSQSGSKYRLLRNIMNQLSTLLSAGRTVHLSTNAEYVEFSAQSPSRGTPDSQIYSVCLLAQNAEIVLSSMPIARWMLNQAGRCHFLPFITVVIACRMIMPAFSVSFFDSPLVIHTFSAGRACHSFSKSLGDTPSATGIALRRVMRTPLLRHYSPLAMPKWSPCHSSPYLVYTVLEQVLLISS